jgi:hypothetical protein
MITDSTDNQIEYIGRTENVKNDLRVDGEQLAASYSRLLSVGECRQSSDKTLGGTVAGSKKDHAVHFGPIVSREQPRVTVARGEIATSD